MYGINLNTYARKCTYVLASFKFHARNFSWKKFQEVYVNQDDDVSDIQHTN